MKVYVLIAPPTKEPTILQLFEGALKPFNNEEYVVANEFLTLHLNKAGLYTSAMTAINSKEFFELVSTKKAISLAEVDFREADAFDGEHPRLTKNIIGQPGVIYDAASFERDREYARTLSSIPELSLAFIELDKKNDNESVSKKIMVKIELKNKIKEAEHTAAATCSTVTHRHTTRAPFLSAKELHAKFGEQKDIELPDFPTSRG